MKILIDMNLSPRLATLLSEAGFDDAHWTEIGAADVPDQALAEGALLTIDPVRMRLRLLPLNRA